MIILSIESVTLMETYLIHNVVWTLLKIQLSGWSFYRGLISCLVQVLFCCHQISPTKLLPCTKSGNRKQNLNPEIKSDKPQETVYMHVFCADTGACMWLDKFKSWNFLLRLVTATLLVASQAVQLSGVKKHAVCRTRQKSCLLVCNKQIFFLGKKSLDRWSRAHSSLL